MQCVLCALFLVCIVSTYGLEGRGVCIVTSLLPVSVLCVFCVVLLREDVCVVCAWLCV